MNTEYMIYQLKQHMEEQGGEKHEQGMYDPCRRYRKGDIVRARLYGRGFLWAKDGQIFRVAEDEKDGDPAVVMETCSVHTGKPVHLSYAEIELVKPIEENRPFELHVADAVYRMVNDHKVMERPFVEAAGLPNGWNLVIQMKFISGEGFQSRLARPMNNWNSYSLNKNDMEVMWREANGEEAAEIAELEKKLED